LGGRASMSDTNAARSVTGFKYMVALQLATRLATFALNTAVVRHVEPAVFGLASQLLTITNITLFLSREALRRTVARSPNASAGDIALLPW
jgi:oligosaccharide translocation protein RFT1